MDAKYLLLRHRDHLEISDLAEYRRLGGFQAFRSAVTRMQPEEVIEVVKSLRLARSRRRRIPYRLEVGFHG
jgi:NADH:ubiquinone oxidoreductase subunit F (NADH-binding)